MITHKSMFQALAITDHPSFRELLIYRRQKTKESDIPHRTKITECVLDRADAIQKELAKELKVSLLSLWFVSVDASS
jgi:hypothetical protein